MQRYFIKNEYFKDNLIEIIDKDFHHIKNVMRNKLNDELVVCNYSNKAFLTKIIDFKKNSVIVEVVEALKTKDNILNLTLAQSLIRKDNFELVLQKTTELGIKSIIPLMTERSVIKLNDLSKKLTRYNLIVKEASEQSERQSIPTITNLMKLKELPYEDYDVVLVAYARNALEAKLSDVLKTIDKTKSILVLVGPEGGFSEKELDYLKDKAKFVSFGPTILRSETAGIYVTSAVRYEMEN